MTTVTATIFEHVGEVMVFLTPAREVDGSLVYLVSEQHITLMEKEKCCGFARIVLEIIQIGWRCRLERIS